MAPRAANDIFLVGDTHQRIYGNQVTLGSLGVHIRGRSARLTLSYRTTRQILGSALGVLSGESFDDLDGSAEDLAGYRSVLTGSLPQLHGCDDWESEQESIAALLADWIALPTPPGQIAVCVPTNTMASELAHTLLAHKGIKAVEIGPEGPRGDEGVHIGTMFRFKGLEYQRMVIAGVRDGLVPREAVTRLRSADAIRYRRELQRARSLLFVAATRSRDSLAIFWHGRPSPFLEPLMRLPAS